MGMKDDMPIPLSMLSISYLNKLKYKGSYNGKRFMFEKYDIKEKKDGNEIVVGSKLIVYVWKDLLSFENTDEKDIAKKEFEYSKDGIDEGIKFVEDFKI